MKTYSSFKDNLNETDNTKPEKNEDLERNIHETFETERGGDFGEEVTQLKQRITELEEQVETMYKANKIVGDNLDTLKI